MKKEGVMDQPFRCVKLEKSFAGNKVLAGVDLAVEPGEVVALLGGNGAGKSTLLRMAFGLLGRDAGELSVLGMDPARRGAEVRARAGWVGDGTRVYDWMTPRGLLEFVAPFYPDLAPAHALELFARLAIPPDAKIASLSRGGLRKLLLALVFARRPELALLDEPTAHVDALVRREFVTELVALLADAGRSVLIASNDPREVESLAERVAILEGGKIVVAGALDDLKRRFRLLRLRLPEPAAAAPALPGLVSGRLLDGGREAELVVDGGDEAARAAALLHPAARIESTPCGLEDLFVAILRKGGHADDRLRA